MIADIQPSSVSSPSIDAVALVEEEQGRQNPSYPRDEDIHEPLTSSYRSSQTGKEPVNGISSPAKAAAIATPPRMPIRFRLLLAVSSGAMAIAGSSISLYAVSGINMEPVQLTHYWMYQSWSALLNPVIGFLSDTVMIGGENRRPLIVTGSLLAAALYFIFAFIPFTTTHYGLFVVLSVMQSWAQSLVTIPINGMLVELFMVLGNAEGAQEESPVDAEAAKRTRIALMSAVQSQAMVYRSLGSLGGSIVYTVAVIWMSLDAMLWVSGIGYLLIVPSVMVLSAAWCKAPLRMQRGPEGNASSRPIVITTIHFGPKAEATAANVVDDQSPINSDDNANEKASLIGSTGRGTTGNDDERKRNEDLSNGGAFSRVWQHGQGIWERIQLGWDWQNPSQGTIGLLFVLVFVFIYSGTLDSSSVYFAYVATQFEFSNWLNSLNMCIGMLGSVVGAYVYGWFIDWLHTRGARRGATGEVTAPSQTTASVPVPIEGGAAIAAEHRRPKASRHGTTAFHIFTFGSICGSLGYLTNVMLATGFVPGDVPIPPYLFVPFDNFMTSVFSRFAFMPIMTVAAERCPEGYEAAAFELFSVMTLLGGSFSAFISGKAAEGLGITSKDYSHTWILLVMCAGCKLLPVVVAALLPVHEKSATAMLVAAVTEGRAAKEDEDKQPKEAVSL